MQQNQEFNAEDVRCGVRDKIATYVITAMTLQYAHVATSKGVIHTRLIIVCS